MWIRKEHQIEAFQLVKYVTLQAEVHKNSCQECERQKRVEHKAATLLASIAVILFQAGDTQSNLETCG